MFHILTQKKSIFQGMNEILGPIYYTFATDPSQEYRGENLTTWPLLLFYTWRVHVYSNVKENLVLTIVSQISQSYCFIYNCPLKIWFYISEFAEADSFFCFTILMGEIRDFFIKTLDDSPCGIGKTELLGFQMLHTVYPFFSAVTLFSLLAFCLRE